MPETKFYTTELTLSPRSEPAGAMFPAKLAYWTIGSPSNPAVVMPSCFGGTLDDTSPFLYSSTDRITDPPLPQERFYIIIVGMLCGGESSSPSNTPAPWDGPRFPRVTYEDNIRLQHALLTKKLGLERFIESAACIAGSARTSMHNWCFLEGPRLALTTAHDFHEGYYKTQPVDGCRAFSRAYSTWALSQAWFRDRCWEVLGFPTLQAYLEAYWSGGNDANDTLAMVWTWQHGDVTVYHSEDEGDLAKALGRIETRMLLMPARTDMYFPPEDNEEELKHLKKGQFACIESIWGHIAGGGGGTKEDDEFIITEIKRFLEV